MNHDAGGRAEGLSELVGDWDRLKRCNDTEET